MATIREMIAKALGGVPAHKATSAQLAATIDTLEGELNAARIAETNAKRVAEDLGAVAAFESEPADQVVEKAQAKAERASSEVSRLRSALAGARRHFEAAIDRERLVARMAWAEKARALLRERADVITEIEDLGDKQAAAFERLGDVLAGLRQELPLAIRDHVAPAFLDSRALGARLRRRMDARSHGFFGGTLMKREYGAASEEPLDVWAKDSAAAVQEIAALAGEPIVIAQTAPAA